MVSFMWIGLLPWLLYVSESKQCNNQIVNCVCENSAIQRLEVRIGLKHLLERGRCNVIKPADCEDWYNEGY
ncbi:hypothetical protein KUTeg_010962 [Tegillarca granosa]|uniref:Uncharacterized protein n=1 Tax=Tegillarca granosa TaxID=220873 RepID=A0ABQ9F6V6_TEGGR|nr:hypothetical protein KUTeg_010962 [Tegillarca granosa]